MSSGHEVAVEGVEANRYRWAILGLSWLAYVSIYLVRTAVPPLSPFIVENLHLSLLEVGLLVSASAIGYTAVQIPTGWLVDRIGVRKMLFAGTFIAGAFVLGIFFVNTLATAIIVLIISGVGCGCFPTVATKALLIWFPMKQRATVFGINQTALNVAGIITAATLPTLAIITGWRTGFIAIGIVSIAVAVIAYAFYRDPPKAANAEAPQRSISPTWRMIRDVILDRNILLISFSCLGLAICMFSFTGYLVIYLKEAVGVSVALAGGYLALANTGGIIGKPFFGAVSDRVFGGSRKKPLLLVGTLIFVFSIIMQVVTSSTPYWMLIAIFFMFGFTAIGWGGMNLVLISEFAGMENAGLAVGYSVTITLIGNIIGPPIFGWITDTTGSYALAWCFLTASALISMLFLVFVQERKRKIRESKSTTLKSCIPALALHH